MQNYTKSIRKELQSLNGLAHERYLDHALGELQQQFSRWEAKEINGFDLNEAIHQFHNGKSRELYNYFIGNRDLNGHRVARAIVEGVISRNELSKEILDVITNIIEQLESDF